MEIKEPRNGLAIHEMGRVIASHICVYECYFDLNALITWAEDPIDMRARPMTQVDHDTLKRLQKQEYTYTDTVNRCPITYLWR